MIDEDGMGVHVGYGEVFKSFEVMQNMFDKLHLLNYEKGYLPMTKLPPLSRIYFIVPRNPGEQYFNFVSLSSWLIQKCGYKKVSMPEESEDPNLVICRILETIRKMGAILDFSPNRLKSGCGPDAVSVLDFLTDKAVLHSGHQWESPVFPPDAIPDVEEVIKKQSICIADIDDETEEILDSDAEGEVECTKGSELVDVNQEQENDERKIIESGTSADEWNLEVERVLPLLMHTAQTDIPDWRWRLSSMKTNTETLMNAIDEIEEPLVNILSDVGTMSEAMIQREHYLSTQFSDRVDELHILQEQIKEKEKRRQFLEEELKIKNEVFFGLEMRNREVLKLLDERTSLLNEGAPITEMRKSLVTVQKDVAKMDILIGILEGFLFKTYSTEVDKKENKQGMEDSDKEDNVVDMDNFHRRPQFQPVDVIVPLSPVDEECVGEEKEDDDDFELRFY